MLLDNGHVRKQYPNKDKIVWWIKGSGDKLTNKMEYLTLELNYKDTTKFHFKKLQLYSCIVNYIRERSGECHTLQKKKLF